MNRLPTTLVRMVALLFLAGCAAAPPTVEQKIVVAEPPAPSIEKGATPPRLTEDRDLFAEGLAFLNQSEPAGPAKARGVFISLRERYPLSRWRSAAESFIRLIDEIDASRESGRQDQLLLEKLRAERPEMLQENESLKKTVRELTEKLHTGTTSLVQENEKLKRDLQRLKDLEIELEKRERMLR
jgi:hypothetical protein